MKRTALAIIVALAFAGINSTTASISSNYSGISLQDTTKKDTAQTPTDTLKTKKPKQ
ncbi:hypothetical protein [Desertivirga xinjiangensis]|uniref:hypothetical protein n=1 Tax=Desertivirga xinjiangensis TaxID=539206 RepID=UPI00210BC701|nr:hypothetical protein [Pedobacter xinjiangensis]